MRATNEEEGRRSVKEQKKRIGGAKEREERGRRVRGRDVLDGTGRLKLDRATNAVREHLVPVRATSLAVVTAVKAVGSVDAPLTDNHHVRAGHEALELAMDTVATLELAVSSGSFSDGKLAKNEGEALLKDLGVGDLCMW